MHKEDYGLRYIIGLTETPGGQIRRFRPCLDETTLFDIPNGRVHNARRQSITRIGASSRARLARM